MKYLPWLQYSSPIEMIYDAYGAWNYNIWMGYGENYMLYAKALDWKLEKKWE